MPLTGKQKAAMLLLSLDAATATELLKGVNHDMVKELAAEVAHLDASGFRSSQQSLEMVRKFHSSLQQKLEFKIKDFLKEMLKSSVGDERAVKIQTQIRDLLQKRDPFISIRSADTQTLVSILGTEHPRAAAVVLSELTAKKSSEVLGLLNEGIRVSAVSRMTSSESTTAEAKAQIAEMICNRLEAAAPGKWTVVSQRPEQSLRKVAVILRNMEKELRDGMLAAIKEKRRRGGQNGGATDDSVGGYSADCRAVATGGAAKNRYAEIGACPDKGRRNNYKENPVKYLRGCSGDSG